MKLFIKLNLIYELGCLKQFLDILDILNSSVLLNLFLIFFFILSIFYRNINKFMTAVLSKRSTLHTNGDITTFTVTFAYFWWMHFAFCGISPQFKWHHSVLIRFIWEMIFLTVFTQIYFTNVAVKRRNWSLTEMTYYHILKAVPGVHYQKIT